MVFEAIKGDEFYYIKKENSMEIQSGEYFEPCNFIYKEVKEKDYGKLKQLIKNNKEAGCGYEDFRGIDLRGMDCQGRNYPYADFSKSTLVESKFSFSDLTACAFQDSEMQDSAFDVCVISGVSFENSQMQNASFRHSISGIGNKFAGIRQKQIFVGTSFKNCCLINANFDNAVIHGADFRGADLHYSSFKNATLYHTRFSIEQAEAANLSLEQKQQIIID